MNPLTMIGQMIKNGGNPQQIFRQMMGNNPAMNNPIMKNAFEMAQKGDSRGVEELARNLCKENVNSVIATDYRNQFDESNPAAVYVINYTYENIGLKEDLYVNFESKVVDNAGKVASSYPGDTEKYPESVPTGAFCEAEVTIGVENAGSFKDYVSIYDDDYNEYSAIFNLEVQ